LENLHVTAELGGQLPGSSCLFNEGSWRNCLDATMEYQVEKPPCHGGSWQANAFECVNFGGNALLRTCVCVFRSFDFHSFRIVDLDVFGTFFLSLYL